MPHNWEKFKSYFNWEIYNRDNAIKSRNLSIIWTSIGFCIVFLLTLIPAFIFTYIVFNNVNLDTYINYTYEQKHVWEYIDVINGKSIHPLLWLGYGFAVLEVVLIFFTKPFVTGNTTKNMRFSYIFMLSVIGFIAYLFFSLSQYQYSRFNDFFVYEAITANNSGAEKFKLIWVQEISEIYAKNYNDQIALYKWESTAVVWWVLVAQTTILFASVIRLQNSIFGKVVHEEYENRIRSTSSTKISKTQRIVRFYTQNNPKNIAFFVLAVGVIVVIPNLVYSILTTTKGTNLNALITWSYKMPNLLRDMSDQTLAGYLQELHSQYYGTLFLIGSLPLIVLGLNIATLFFFFAILIRGENISNYVFVFELVIVFFELFLLIITMFVSKIYLTRLNEFWNASFNGNTRGFSFFNEIKLRFADNQSDYQKLIDAFPNTKLGQDQGFKNEWFGMPGIISEIIIGLSFVFGAFIFMWYGIYILIIQSNLEKLKQKHLKKRLKRKQRREKYENA